MMYRTPTTQELMQAPDALSFHPGRPVSTLSVWSDTTWRLDAGDPGHSASGIPVYWGPGLPAGWNPALPGGGVDPVDAAIVDDFRRLVWVALADPRIGFVRKITGAASIMTGVTALMRHMIANRLSSFEQLTPAVVDDYVGRLSDEFAETERAALERGEPADEDEGGAVAARGRRSRKASLASLVKVRVATIGFVWQARRQLSAAGVPVPATDPLRARSPSKVADHVVTVVEDAIPPIPDEVYLRIINAAERVITVHADDVFEAQNVWFEHTGGLGTDHERAQAYEALRALTLDTHGATRVPWPSTLTEPGLANTGRSTSPSLALHNLVSTLRDVCLLTVMSTAGMRLSEVVSIRGGWTPGAAHPDCIVVERSHSGDLDLFFVRARLTKRQATPVEDLWLVGSRLAGAGETPLAVRAIETLEQLMSPWRGMSPDGEARTALSVCMDCPGMPWKPTSIRRVTRHRFAVSVKQFYRRFVDLSGLPDVGGSLDAPDIRPYRDTKCANVRTHQYRKNFAKFMVRLDGRLLPAIKRQFKHLRIATVQTGYLGRNPAMYFGGNDERRLSSNHGIARMLGLDAPGGSHVHDVISRHERLLYARRTDVVASATAPRDGKGIPDGTDACRHLPDLDGAEDRAVRAQATRHAIAAALDPDVRTAGSLPRLVRSDGGPADAAERAALLLEGGAVLIPAEHGSCGIGFAPHLSRCNGSTGSASFLNGVPDALVRSPTVCGGCQLFLADATHVAYWRRRYLVNERVLRRARRAGLESEYWIAGRRAEQSRAMLRALGWTRYDR